MNDGRGDTKILTDHTVKARHPFNACLYQSWHDSRERTTRPRSRPAEPGPLGLVNAARTVDTHFIMRSATLVSWLITASLGAFMLRTWLARGGLRRERAKPGGLPPQLVFGHAAAAVCGLLTWVAFLVCGVRPLAWAAVGLLMAAIGLGLCTVTLWTPYPARKPGRPVTFRPGDPNSRGEQPTDQATDQKEGVPAQSRSAMAGMARESDDLLAVEVTDEMIARLLAEPARAPRHRPVRPDPAVLVPVAHGFAAIGTFMLAVMSAVR
jgi:hypothetical protein